MTQVTTYHPYTEERNGFSIIDLHGTWGIRKAGSDKLVSETHTLEDAQEWCDANEVSEDAAEHAANSHQTQQFKIQFTRPNESKIRKVSIKAISKDNARMIFYDEFGCGNRILEVN